ncbi:MAG: DoxX family membrane protein [Bacteroidetes bacterium]|nr:DoxX family membrane protein [Bacteroidota bacterium]
MSRELVQKILSISLGVMFIFSGISKLFPIEAFETVTVQQGIMNWELVPWFSRAMISFELFLGLLFLLNIKLRKFTLPASFLLLLVFTVYLAILEFTGKGGDNCGCFGEMIPMTALQSILKNLIFMGTVGYLYFAIEAEKKYTFVHIAAGYVVVLVTILVLFPVKPYEVLKAPEVSKPLLEPVLTDTMVQTAKTDSLNSIEKETNKKKDTVIVKKSDEKPPLASKYPPVVSIYSQLVPGADKGIMIVAFLSLDCDHCLAVATALNQNSASLKRTGRYYLFLGSEDQIEPFFSKSGGSVSYNLLTPQKFYPHLNSAPPKVILLVNGNIVLTMEGESVNVKTIIDRINELTLTYLI